MGTLVTAPRDLEADLFARARAGERDARSQLVERFLPLARSVAVRFWSTPVEKDDLIQVASFGLLKAIDRYDPTYGAAFSTFAVPTIRGEIKRHLRDSSWALRVPRALQERSLQVERALGDLEPALGRSPSAAEIADHTGHSREEVVEALEVGASRFAGTLDASSGRDDSTRLSDRLGTEDAGYTRVDDFLSAAPAFDALPPREQTILRLRFHHDLTQLEISRELGISQMHVSRLLRRSLEAMAETLAA